MTVRVEHVEVRANGRSRLFSGAELLLGAFLVIGHNVFRVLPNEVPILFALALISAKLRNGTLGAIGLRRPDSWPRVVLIALAAAATRIALGDFVILPMSAHWWPAPAEAAEASRITGNLGIALVALLVVWSFAAFGEEIAYRGYLLRRAAEVGRSTTAATLMAIVVTSVLFGYGHYYKGPAGIVDSGVAGLILALAFLVARRNLWACILGHGFIDTYAVVVTYLGLDW